VITFAGEILPQAYFSRHALRVAAALAPVMKLYRLLLFPVAAPVAWVLDRWLGPEGLHYYREKDLRELIRQHVEAEETDITPLEGRGALNFLDIDDLAVTDEGEPLDPKSILELPHDAGRPIFPELQSAAGREFLADVGGSERKWVVVVDEDRKPTRIIDADGFLRACTKAGRPSRPFHHVHRPLVIRDPRASLEDAIRSWSVVPDSREDDVIDLDVVLIWTDQPRIITGADVLGRLLRGIVARNRPERASA
jgi:hypothetical protein